MLKKLLSLFIISLFAVSSLQAQCTPDITLTIPGVYPDSATGLGDATQGVAYSQVIQVRTFLDSSASAGPFGTTNFRLDYIEIDGVTGLPNGLSYSCNPSSCQFQELSNGCVLISGTTTDPVGTYPITVDVTAHGNLTQLGNIPFNQSFSVSYYDINVNLNTGLAELLPKNKFGVTQNSPNPFGNKSQIFYNTPQPAKLTMKVFNILGKEVYATNFDSKKGLNVYTLDADKFSSGIYMYSISNGSGTVTKRMVVSKK
jgi:hypothetical protein